MLVTIAYFPGDRDQAVRLADWMNELGSYPNHELFILRDARCEPIPQLGKTFGSTKEILAHAQIDGWPEGANYFFRTITAILANQTGGPRYFLWMEPDCIPLTPDWLDKIEAEFLACKKPFMGDRVEVENIPLHQSGIGVYPNPLHAWAGEAYRAADEAFDMAGRHQIVPQSHFTKLIEHAWRHETFTNLHELQTQIRPEAVLFHASKDGSLITLLRDKKKGGDARCVVTDGQIQEETSTHTMCSNAAPTVQPASAATCDIFIRTYEKDYGWLKYCLKSIHKFCIGFRKIWIVSPTEDPASAFFDPQHIEWKVLNEESEDGYLSQQIHKLYADVITDYEADHILFMDSDTLFTQPVTPQMFFKDEKIVWYYTPYDHTDTPWKPITEKFMAKEVQHEFMRRHPFVVPRWLFPRFREYCHATHGMILSEYIKIQPNRSFSEFNALGAFAYEKYRDKFAWVNTVEEQVPPPVVRQFFSWGNITDEVQKEINEILSQTKVSGETSPVVSELQGRPSLREVRGEKQLALSSSETGRKEDGSGQVSGGEIFDESDTKGNQQVSGSLSAMPQSSTLDSTTQADRRSQDSGGRTTEGGAQQLSSDHKQKELSEMVRSWVVFKGGDGECYCMDDNGIRHWLIITPESETEIKQILGTGTVESVSIPGPTITSSVPSHVEVKNNGDSPGDHIRWLRDYVKEKPTRRQYILLQLKKAGLQPKWKRKS